MRFGGRTAKGRLPRGTMNKLESAYSDHLCVLTAAGEILWWKFEGMKFRLADGAFYTPDFAVMMADGSLEIHEVKGHWEEAARVRIKVAAEIYPMRFLAITSVRKQWVTETIGEGKEPRHI